MERKPEERIEEIRANGGEVYSISRLNTINQCPYSAYLQYIKGVKSKPNVWSELGGITHDALEACVKDGADESCIRKAIEEELEMLDTLGIDFPLDRLGNPSLRNNWIADMQGFANHFKTPKGKFETEQFVLYQIYDDSWMQGYIDLIRYNDDGTISIYDWKTSSNFDKLHLEQAGRQLVFYMLAKEAEGFKVRDVSWVMLKYATVSWLAKNGKKQTKTMEWRKVGTEMRKKIEKDMIDAGYTDIDIEIHLGYLLEDGDFSRQVPEVKDKYTLSPYVRQYEVTDAIIDETLEYIKDTIIKFKKWGDNEDDYYPLDCFENEFFCNNLCGYGRSGCKHYADYLVECEINYDEIEDLFT